VIDLHSHTTASDGQHSPSELVRLAAEAGITHLAITDHDTVAGLAEAAEAAQARGLTLVPGIELSAFIGDREVHVLGHFIQPNNPELFTLSNRMRKEREQRMRRMIEKLNQLGVPITFEQVIAIARDANLGRPHLARALVEKRVCLSVKEAFERFLAAGRAAFVPRERISARDAIRLIRGAGGTATIAHPAVSGVSAADLRVLRQDGLDGLEVFHADQNPSTQAKFLAIAKELQLVPTAGSDFHGEQVAPGRKLGLASTEPRHFEELQRRAGQAGVA
jgi:predicted metal-dependent phosphoesterase TrpH